MLDFKALKEIPLTQVLAKYGVPLTFAGKYAKAKCPLPSHKANDKDRNFNINLSENYWRCFSASCNEKAGAKGGDVINFVATMENCSQHEAAKKLAGWFHVADAVTTSKTGSAPKSSTNEKAAPRIEKRPDEKAHIEQSQRTGSHTTSSNGKSNSDTKGYMVEVDTWFDEMIVRGDQESEVDWLHRVRNAVKGRLVESFRAGKRVQQGLPARSNS